MDFKNLFEQVKQFKKEQEKQKQRGLNNYNMFTTISKAHYENNHSKMIASFLDPFGEHYQSTLFLDKFLEILDISTFKIDSKNCSIYLEYQNIDLYITDGDKHIIIENKVYAKDQKRQIERYIKIIKDENQDLKPHDILVIYLSLDRNKPTQYSLGNLSVENGTLTVDTKEITLFKSIHYKNEILKWLEKCKYEVQNITNLNEVFRQYIDVVKMINNQYKDKIMSLSDYIQENKEVYKLAMELEKELPIVRENIVNTFFYRIVSSLQIKLNSDWIVEFKGTSSKRHSLVLKIYKKNWTGVDNLILGFEFGKTNYYNGYLGVVPKNKNVENLVEIFNKKLNSLNYELETTRWWLHWEWLPNIYIVDDFIDYIQFHENSEKEFFDGIMGILHNNFTILGKNKYE